MDSLGDRIKANYEDRFRFYLPRRIPVMLRVDGCHFHTFTKKCKKPFDNEIIDAMRTAALYVSQEMQGFKAAYIQSDEATFLITDYDELTTEAWFGYNKSKMETVTSSLFTAHFNQIYQGLSGRKDLATFDCRSYSIPREEVSNAFLWRSQDWARNSVQMMARSHFSHKELHKKNTSDIHEMLHKIGVNWAKADDIYKNGTFIVGKNIRHDITSTFKEINDVLSPFLDQK